MHLDNAARSHPVSYSVPHELLLGLERERFYYECAGDPWATLPQAMESVGRGPHTGTTGAEKSVGRGPIIRTVHFKAVGD